VLSVSEGGERAKGAKIRIKMKIRAGEQLVDRGQEIGGTGQRTED
jgi:hypothetical protein